MEETEPTLCRKPCFEAVLYGLLSRISRLTLVQQVAQRVVKGICITL